MLSRNNHQEQLKKYEPKKQRFTIKKLSIGVASVLLGISFANSVSADTTDANADANTNNGDGSEQTDHNLVLNSANNQTLKEATAANQVNGATATSQNPAGDVQTPAANEYEAAVNAAMASEMAQSNAVASTAAASTVSATASSASNTATPSASTTAQDTSSTAVNQQSTASQSAVETSATPESTVADTQDASTATQTFSPRSFALNDTDMASLLGTSLVATDNNVPKDVDDYNTKYDFNNETIKANFNFKNSNQVYDGHVVYSGYTDKKTGVHWQFATDPDNPGQTIYLYRNGTLADSLSANSGNSRSVYIGSNQTVNGSSYKGGQYTFNVSSSNKGGIAFSRLDIVGQNGSVVSSGMTADITQSGKTLVMDLDKNEANPATWQSGGASVPTKVKQTIWYVDATTGKKLAKKESDATLSGSTYDVTKDQVPLIKVDGKYYKLVERSNNTVQKTVRIDASATSGMQTTTEPVTESTYKSDGLTDEVKNTVLATNNGVEIKVSDLLNVPLTGTLSSLRIGDVGITNTGYDIATGALIPNRFLRCATKRCSRYY